MPVLETEEHGKSHLAQPGRYALTRTGARPPGDTPPESAAAALLVALAGDFLLVAGDNDAGRVVLNGHRPLGGLERLRDGDRIEIDAACDGVGAPRASQRVRFVYRHGASAVVFDVSPALPVHCAYSGAPLAGRTAVRCGNCGRRYALECWHGELGRACAACAWPLSEDSA